jgi:hypothetical protein
MGSIYQKLISLNNCIDSFQDPDSKETRPLNFNQSDSDERASELRTSPLCDQACNLESDSYPICLGALRCHVKNQTAYFGVKKGEIDLRSPYPG